MFFFRKIQFFYKKRANVIFFEFSYQVTNIEFDENIKMKITKKIYEIEIIKNNKIFKINEISNKFYNEFDFYYLIK